MCRLLFAYGKVDVHLVLKSAKKMASGIMANHDSPITRHPDGWGAAWYYSHSEGWNIHRNDQPIFENISTMPLEINSGLKAGVRIGRTEVLEPKFLAVHCRHSTLVENQGLQFSH